MLITSCSGVIPRFVEVWAACVRAAGVSTCRGQSFMQIIIESAALVDLAVALPRGAHEHHQGLDSARFRSRFVG